MVLIMNYEFHFGPWDLALLLAVTAQATAIAYLHHPRWKVLLYSLPVPFTISSLALGSPVDVTNIAGVLLLMLFGYGVRHLHYSLRVPILPSITISALGYALVGTVLARIIPRNSSTFWIAAVTGFLVALVLLVKTVHHLEPGHRSPVALWAKMLVIAGVVSVLIAAKSLLSGFMTVFPMVGVVAAYEVRHSLRTFCRQLPALAIALLAMMVTVRILQTSLGLGLAVVVSWTAFLLSFLPLFWVMWFRKT